MVFLDRPGKPWTWWAVADDLKLAPLHWPMVPRMATPLGLGAQTSGLSSLRALGTMELLPMRLDVPFVEKKGAEPTVATLLSAMQLLLLV